MPFFDFGGPYHFFLALGMSITTLWIAAYAVNDDDNKRVHAVWLSIVWMFLAIYFVTLGVELNLSRPAALYLLSYIPLALFLALNMHICRVGFLLWIFGFSLNVIALLANDLRIPIMPQALHESGLSSLSYIPLGEDTALNVLGNWIRLSKSQEWVSVGDTAMLFASYVAAIQLMPTALKILAGQQGIKRS